MFSRQFVAIGTCMLWLTTTAGLTRKSTPHTNSHTEKNKSYNFYFPFPTENCPDECMYIPECGTGRVDLTDKEILGRANVSESYFAPGNGNCERLYELDRKYCPIASYGECLMKCAGLRCSTPEHNGYDIYSPIPSDRYERMVEAYRKANNTAFTMANFRHIH